MPSKSSKRELREKYAHLFRTGIHHVAAECRPLPNMPKAYRDGIKAGKKALRDALKAEFGK